MLPFPSEYTSHANFRNTAKGEGKRIRHLPYLRFSKNALFYKNLDFFFSGIVFPTRKTSDDAPRIIKIHYHRVNCSKVVGF